MPKSSSKAARDAAAKLKLKQDAAAKLKAAAEAERCKKAAQTAVAEKAKKELAKKLKLFQGKKERHSRTARRERE